MHLNARRSDFPGLLCVDGGVTDPLPETSLAANRQIFSVSWQPDRQGECGLLDSPPGETDAFVRSFR